ncbi:MAG TPA: MBL fold metallo-hydrolase [Acidobacteriota bacterium]|nr:MBL fold metallo-hydrolase [Acidobacteriota bacterium]HRR25168.1 MBL fold metallo-hydrolase [Acidobacteriota bacterium]HRR55666.1 MBL fold metallo-hydrolase [Acidobacteriota bacterium]HRV08266.1 MBL fold metallo-hydrolase [Acidobacteriota bacterium]
MGGASDCRTSVLTVLDTGDAFSAERFGTSFLWSVPVESGSRLILVDGPPGLLQLLRRRGVGPDAIGEVILTHVHPDHSAGVATLTLWRRYLAGSKTVLHTSQAVYDTLTEGWFPAFQNRFSEDLRHIVCEPPSAYVEFNVLEEWKSNDLGDNAAVEIRHNWHPTPTLGLKIAWRESLLGMGGDTCFSPALLRSLYESGVLDRRRYHQLAGPWLWEAGLIYHEAGRGGGHTLEEDLLALEAGILPRIRLVHLPDGFHPKRLPAAKAGESVIWEPEGGVRLIDSTLG